jgi:hypothetical protein
MSKRTKFEVDILAKVILTNILSARAAKLNSRAMKIEVEKYAKKHKIDASLKRVEILQKERDLINKELDSIGAKMKRQSDSEYTYLSKERVYEAIAKKLAKYKPITITDVKEQIITSLDDGADILKQNITKLFV